MVNITDIDDFYLLTCTGPALLVDVPRYMNITGILITEMSIIAN